METEIEGEVALSGRCSIEIFFAQLRAKHINETIYCIKKEDGNTITDKKEILRETEHFYRDLFTRDEAIWTNDREC